MRIMVETPDPKFEPGDIVELPNTRNDKSIIVRITGFSAEGVWKQELGQKKADVTLTVQVLSTDSDDCGGDYVAKVLPGSYHDTDPPVEWHGSDTLVKNQKWIERIGKKI